MPLQSQNTQKRNMGLAMLMRKSRVTDASELSQLSESRGSE